MSHDFGFLSKIGTIGRSFLAADCRKYPVVDGSFGCLF